ncbi:30S ribosomal protein S16 [Georgenia deserti]|uniref:Small ribosomal subunit protein bS16 n=1 Tax=Georgenia deserti TaxID=2093781 RepID=A0ABW4L933_9MICO
MAVKIRLKRMGKVHAPYYRVVVMDSRKKRDGKAIEEIGKYHPTDEPSFIDIDSDRAQYWLSVGAQPTEQVAALLKVTGDWQKFKGIDGATSRLRTKDTAAAEEVRSAAVKAAEEEAELRKAKAAEASAQTEEPAAEQADEGAAGSDEAPEPAEETKPTEES